VTATIEAKYYFGAPVTSAMVKYKVMRTSHSTRWYPTSPLGLDVRQRLLVVRRGLRLVSRLRGMGLPSSDDALVGQKP